MNENFVKKLSANVEGRDFIVGDLHGCYDELLNLLSAVSFDIEKDRLISTGDLIDRGPKPVECMALLEQSWFHCVKGNHESLLTHKATVMQQGNYETIESISAEDRAYIKKFNRKSLQKIDTLPYVIEVEHLLLDKYYVVHAEFLPEHLFDKKTALLHKKEYMKFLNKIAQIDNTHLIQDFLDNFNDTHENTSLKEKLLWSRKIITEFYSVNKDKINKYDFSFLEKKVDTQFKVFCGHNIVPFPMKIGQQYYLDTGAALGYTEKGNNSNFKIFNNFGHQFFGLSILDVGSGEVYECITNENQRGKVKKMKNSLYGNN